MIISASRRTDIPSFFADWFIERTRAKSVCVQNPRNPAFLKNISLNPGEVDGIVFWTKNPQPLLLRLDELKDYVFYFQYTLNSYGPDVEPRALPYERRINMFRELWDKLGPHGVIFRYDPIVITCKYDMSWHMESFEKTIELLKGYTDRCVISFVDTYRKNSKKLHSIGALAIDEQKIFDMSRQFAVACEKSGIKLFACAEPFDLTAAGIGKSKCVDAQIFREITGKNMASRKSRTQRKECSCDESLDIGRYGTCPAGCIYCYANQNVS